MRISVEGRVFTFDEDEAENTELMAIEDATGLTITEWSDAVNRGSMRAITALVWILRRRDGEPDLAYGDVTFKAASLALLPDEPEPEAGKES